MADTHHIEVARELLAEYPNDLRCSDCEVSLFRAPHARCTSWEHVAVYVATGLAPRGEAQVTT